MKQGTNFIFSISIGYLVDDIKKATFKFFSPKSGKELIFEYPSSTAVRRTGLNIIDLYWTQSQTFQFNPGLTIMMDSLIKPISVSQNPLTPVIKLTMSPTLFTKELVTKYG